MKSKSRIALSALFTMLVPSILMVALVASGTVGNIDPNNFKTSVIDLNKWFLNNYQEEVKEESLHEAPVVEEIPGVSCFYEKPEDPNYAAKLVGVRKDFKLNKNEVFETKVYLENTGNVPWFSDDTDCLEQFRLGTAREKDRASVFYSSYFVDENAQSYESRWVSKNRIKMSTLRVDPGDIGEFIFYSKAPNPDDVYIEYFSPVIENVGWLEGVEFPIIVHVGSFQEDTEQLALKMKYLDKSMKTSEADFSGGKSVEVDLSDQMMFVKIGNYILDKFQISSGQPSKHPTPRGTYEILFKQKVRIGGASPHYIMPDWQAFRWDGYGLHSLPSLGSAELRAKIRAYGPDEEVPVELYYGDALWTEALDHMGNPVSHGCVRMPPVKSNELYQFTDVGTPVVIHD